MLLSGIDRVRDNALLENIKEGIQCLRKIGKISLLVVQDK